MQILIPSHLISRANISARSPSQRANQANLRTRNGTRSYHLNAIPVVLEDVVIPVTQYSLQAQAFIEKKVPSPSVPLPDISHQHEFIPRTRTVLIAGNWKMNPTSVKEAKELSALVASAMRTLAQDKPLFDVEVAVIPPTPFLPFVAEALEGTATKLGAQDCHPGAKGAFTGEVSTGMLSSLGTSFVLAGHSERRVLFKEDDDFVNKKVQAILAAGMSPILCIGESKSEYENGLARNVCATQLRGGLKGISSADMSRVVIAYEPVWAIGTGLSATPAIAQCIHAFIRSVVEDMYGPEVAAAIRIQYGGSVTPESIDELMTCPDIDGCLVGGASLAADKFARIFSFQPPLAGSPRKLYAYEVVSSGCTLGESVVWSDRLQRLFWVDSVGKALWCWDPVMGGAPLRWDFPEVVGCVALREDGDLLLGLQSGIWTFRPATGAARKIADFERKLDTRPNDGRVDRAGNFVIGSYNNAHRQDGAEIGGLYRLSPDGSMREILDYKFRCSNCICFSPDGLTMYFTDTPTRRIFAFDYNPAGPLSNRRLLYEMPSHLPGGPDGAQTDVEGYLWACLSGASQVVRIHPETGVVDTVVELPVTQPTCCTIGGADMDTLYVSTRKADGGGLYAVQLPKGIKGNLEPEFGPHAMSSKNSAAAVSRAVTSFPTPHQDRTGLISRPGVMSLSGPSVYCHECGMAHVSPSAKFCTGCGAPRI